VLQFLTRFTILLKIYLWLKPRLLGLFILLTSIFIITYSHSEYISWVQISEKKIFLGYSYILKNILIVLSILIYFILTKNKYKKSSSVKKYPNETMKVETKETFETLKNKGELKTEYQRILEGSDDDKK